MKALWSLPQTLALPVQTDMPSQVQGRTHATNAAASTLIRYQAIVWHLWHARVLRDTFGILHHVKLVLQHITKTRPATSQMSVPYSIRNPPAVAVAITKLR